MSRELFSPGVLKLLADLPPYDEAAVFTLTSALRKQGVSASLTAALLTQSRLRAKAETKFGPAARTMLFTAGGLEQATRPFVAAHHAQRYIDAGCRNIADITCGIGADSLGFATAGLNVIAVDIDPETAEIAHFNICAVLDSATTRGYAEGQFASGGRTPAASHRMTGNALGTTEGKGGKATGVGRAEVVCGDGLQVARERSGALDGVFADPARRERETKGARKQIWDPEAYLPPLSQVIALKEIIPAVGIKVAPVIPHDAVPVDGEAQWVSVNGDVVECGLWFGPLASNGYGRTALLIKTGMPDGERSRLVTAQPGAELEVGKPGQYLFEPDGAIIRAGLLATAAAELNAHQLDPTIAYLTGDKLPEADQTPPQFQAPLQYQAPPQYSAPNIASVYQILDNLPFNIKQLKAYLRQRNVGRVTIKKRGTDVTPEQLRPQLALKGDSEATLVVTRVAGAHQVLIVEPVRK